MKFAMPMVRDFVPKPIRPWIYLLIAFGFQMGGGMYMGAMNDIRGEMALMREDVQMCNYCTLIGMSIYFPLLFRMKFRFTNKQLHTASAIVMLLCNLAAPHIRLLPLLWAVCFVSGMAKIQGTFECMSNIQLWMTPERKFTVFFPWLQMMILCLMQVSDLLTVYLAYYYHWTYMNHFVIGYMAMILLFVTCCVRPFRFMKPMPLYGIDWLGMLLWAAVGLEISALFCYGDWLDWWTSPVFCQIAAALAITLFMALRRMVSIRHPYYEPKMWTYRHLAPVLLLITLVEGLLSSEYVLEEIFYEEVMHYAATVSVQLDWVAIGGIVTGCLLSLWWMHARGWSYIRLCSVGLAALSAYFVSYYFLLSRDVYLWQLALPVYCRGLAYAVLCSAFFVWLNELMTFQHFFQALSVFNMLHAVVGGVLGGAVYARCLAYLIPDNMSRYGSALERTTVTARQLNVGGMMDRFVSDMMEVSIRQIYGALAYAALFFLALFLLYDTPVRTTLKQMPSWENVAKGVAKGIRRLRKF